MKKFKKFYIEITSICNLACSFCPETKRTKQFITVDDFNKRLDQIKSHTDSIYLHVKGEPLLHPKIDELLDLSYEKGFKVNITTNGTLIKKVKHKLMDKPALRQMNFSLHSFDGHTGDSMTDKVEYLNQILTFVDEIHKNSNVIISFRLWNLDEDNMTNLQKNRNRELLSMIENHFDLDFQIEEKVERGTGVKIKERIYLNQEHEFKWPSLEEEEDFEKGFCHGLRNQAAILANGTVVPCCLDGEGIIDLGNINERAFSEIIEGERALKIYEGFSRREAVEELCRKCGYRKRFG